MTDYSEKSDDELAVLVAERVMEWRQGPDFVINEAGEVRMPDGAWSPCTDPRDWWPVVERMCERGFTWRLAEDARVVFAGSFSEGTAKAGTIGRAVCIAALRAAVDKASGP